MTDYGGRLFATSSSDGRYWFGFNNGCRNRSACVSPSITTRSNACTPLVDLAPDRLANSSPSEPLVWQTVGVSCVAATRAAERETIPGEPKLTQLPVRA
jgi:hypothetical protein